MERLKLYVSFSQEWYDTELPMAENFKYQTENAAGIDLRAVPGESVVIHPGQMKKVRTGISVAIEEDYFGLVAIRSSLGFKHGVTLANGVGVIDSDYRGELGLMLVNHGEDTVTIEGGERVAQLLILPHSSPLIAYVDDVTKFETERGVGGFGSTGKF